LFRLYNTFFFFFFLHISFILLPCFVSFRFPLSLGLKGQSQSNTTLAVQTDGEGKVKYETLLGHTGTSLVFSRAEHAKSTAFDSEALQRPEQEAIEELNKETQQQIEKIVGIRVASTLPSKPSIAPKEDVPQYIRYTPAQSSANFNSGAKTRTIKVVTAQKDPIDPSYFKYIKAPRAPPEAPAPVLHSPPKKLTPSDYAAWKIPPAVSNWKNNLGFAIALDKRLAADGRDLETPVLSDKFASLSTAMTIAESAGRSEIDARKRTIQKVREQEQEEKNRQLSELANEVRRDAYSSSAFAHSQQDTHPSSTKRSSDAGAGDEDTEDMERKSKSINDVLHDVKRTTEREYKLNKYKGNKVSINQRDTADPSSLSKSKAAPSSEAIYDRRLFNQEGGLESGFGNDDDYNVYTKPLFSTEHSGTLYRPVGDADTYGITETEIEKVKDTTRFQPDQGFEGAEKGSSVF
jgi:SNW domain-containing protein 1